MPTHRIARACLALMIICSGVAPAAPSRPGRATQPVAAPPAAANGQRPYQMTELDWLVLELNSCCRDAIQPDAALGFHFVAEPPSTVIIDGSYPVGVDAMLLRKKLDSLRAQVMAAADRRGWRWVKTRETSRPFQ